MNEGHNGIDPVVAKRWLSEALRVYGDLDAQKIENMNAARAIRGRLPDIYESAKNAGLPLKAFKLMIKQRLIEQKIADLEQDINDLTPEDDEDAETFEQFQAAIGDFGELPLGAAALDRKAGETSGNSDDERDVRPAFLREKDASDAEIGRANGEKVAKGIRGLPGADASEA